MAGFRETVQIVVDVVTGSAKSELGKTTQAIKDADTAAGKAKAGISGALSTITGSAALSGAAIGAMAIGAGKAIGDLIGSYLELSDTVDDFRVVSGLSAEAASRWVGAAHDLGLPVDALQSSMAKTATNIGNNPQLLKEFGVQAAYAHDGSFDLGETLLRVTDRMAAVKDPTKQAEIGTALFGKSWQNLIPIIDNGSARVRELANATKTVFTQAELDRNEKMTQDLRKWGEWYDSLKVKAASSSVGIIEANHRTIGDMFSVQRTLDNIGSAWDSLTGKVDHSKDQLGYYKQAVDDVTYSYHLKALAGQKAADDEAAAAQKALDKIHGMSAQAQSDSLQIPIELTYDAAAQWTAYQKALADAANRSPLTASMFLIGGGSGLGGVDSVAAANASAKAAADYLRRNGK